MEDNLFRYMKKNGTLITLFVLFTLIMNKSLTLFFPLFMIEASASTVDASTITVPDAVEQIDDYAFQGCEALDIITIPASVTAIGTDVFSGCAEDFLICSEADSFAERYAMENDIDYQAGTVYRALLIGNTYSHSSSLRLYGTENDVSGMKSCIVQYKGTPYNVRVRTDQDVDGILGNIQTFFGQATKHDVSLFYFSGHGIRVNGELSQVALLGNDGDSFLTADALRTAMDNVLGRKIIIIDACYSGGFVSSISSKGNSSNSEAGTEYLSELDLSSEYFVKDFIHAFSRRGRSALMDRYFVIAAADENEISYEDQQNGITMGVFTSKLIQGCGWDIINRRSQEMFADCNENDVITIQEIYDYTHQELMPLGQHVNVFPENCAWFGLFRKTIPR